MNIFKTKYVALINLHGLLVKLTPWFAVLTVMTLGIGLYLALFVAPPDYKQGDAYRIMFIHVPSAWMSMFTYVFMATASAAALIWRTKLAEIIASAAAPIGASFTLMALISGSIWGKPMWGTWWAWDARLTSELILLFLYLGFMALEASIEDPKRAARACAILALIGVVDIPIIHFSVEWWNTLHQPASLSKIGKPEIHSSMLPALFTMLIAFKLYFLTVLMLRVRAGILWRERYTQWVGTLFRSQNG